MSSFFTSREIRFFPDEDDISNDGFGNDYPFDVPTVYVDGISETYAPQYDFSWSDDSVVLEREGIVIKYTQHFYTELFAEDENGNKIWVDGRTAPCEDCWDGHYLGESRPAESFTTTVYDLKTLTKKKYEYKLSEEDSEPMNEYEIRKYANANATDTEKSK